MADDAGGTPGARKDHPDVVIHPPVLLAIVLVVTLALDWLWPWRTASTLGTLAGWPLGLGLVVAGFALVVWSFLAFRRAGTNVPTFQPTLALVDTGPYGITRNPIYVSLVTALAGLALLIGNMWLLVSVIPFALVLHFGVVKREEAYLRQLFGERYESYARRIPRWLGF